MEPREYLRLMASEQTTTELVRHPVYESLYDKAVELIRGGENPFTVAMALASLTSILLEAIDECSSKRAD